MVQFIMERRDKERLREKEKKQKMELGIKNESFVENGKSLPSSNATSGKRVQSAVTVSDVVTDQENSLKE